MNCLLAIRLGQAVRKGDSQEGSLSFEILLQPAILIDFPFWISVHGSALGCLPASSQTRKPYSRIDSLPSMARTSQVLLPYRKTHFCPVQPLFGAAPVSGDLFVRLVYE